MFVLEIKCNLRSVGQLVQKGYFMVMKNGMFELFDANQRLVLKFSFLENRTFKVSIKSVEVFS